jgi:hypothetical protein
VSLSRVAPCRPVDSSAHRLLEAPRVRFPRLCRQGRSCGKSCELSSQSTRAREYRTEVGITLMSSDRRAG